MAEPTRREPPRLCFDDVRRLYDGAWDRAQSALLELAAVTDDYVEASRRRALDEAGVAQILDDMLLLELLGEWEQ
jgi:hypothetical protein